MYVSKAGLKFTEMLQDLCVCMDSSLNTLLYIGYYIETFTPLAVMVLNKLLVASGAGLKFYTHM